MTIYWDGFVPHRLIYNFPNKELDKIRCSLFHICKLHCTCPAANLCQASVRLQLCPLVMKRGYRFGRHVMPVHVRHVGHDLLSGEHTWQCIWFFTRVRLTYTHRGHYELLHKDLVTCDVRSTVGEHWDSHLTSPQMHTVRIATVHICIWYVTANKENNQNVWPNLDGKYAKKSNKM